MSEGPWHTDLVSVLLLRHAHALSRSQWEGDDTRRELSSRGRTQADALVNSLKGYRPKRILSSPFLRCMDTVGPLGAALGVEVEAVDALAEGTDDEAVELVRKLAGERAVLCSHGDVIPKVLISLVEVEHVDLGPKPRIEKGSVWVISSRKGHIWRASYLEPPSGR
jgi:broad specificity phosphatase PhoE